jgi:hypothetical protein
MKERLKVEKIGIDLHRVDGSAGCAHTIPTPVEENL